MKKHFTDKRTGIGYTLQGDYYLPDLSLPTEEKHENIGVWGMRHKRFLKENHRVLYVNLLTSGKLGVYLDEVEQQAAALFLRLAKNFPKKRKCNGKLKGNQMAWVQRINNIRNRATEIVNAEIIYTV